jgi:hypothetical protein
MSPFFAPDLCVGFRIHGFYLYSCGCGNTGFIAFWHMLKSCWGEMDVPPSVMVASQNELVGS